MSELNYMPAHQLAAMIRQRQVSAVEVLDAHLAQIARHNLALNAIVTLDAEHARARAQAADTALSRGDVWGPLHGVPVTIKDAIATAGIRTTSGFPPWADFVPAKDAPVVARLRAAGAIILGKTNLPTLSGDGQTNNPIFGRSNNPWDLTRTPGGSGGGGSAALAAGLMPHRHRRRYRRISAHSGALLRCLRHQTERIPCPRHWLSSEPRTGVAVGDAPAHGARCW